MDSKRSPSILIKGVVLIVLAVVAVFLIVYATNRDRLRRVRPQSGEAASGITLTETEQETSYGIQIGDNLKAFLTDESFFDPIGASTQETYVEEDVTAVWVHVQSDRNMITIRVTDTDSQLITGKAFAAIVTRIGGATGRTNEMVFTDDDMDGVIRTGTLTDGNWTVVMRPFEGYHMPTEEVSVAVGNVNEEGDDDGTD